MKVYILHWLDGGTEEIRGDSIYGALARAGYDDDVFLRLDYYEELRSNID